LRLLLTLLVIIIANLHEIKYFFKSLIIKLVNNKNKNSLNHFKSFLNIFIDFI